MTRADLIRQNGHLKSENTDLVAKNEELKFQLAQLRRMIFGAKSERFIPSTTPIEQLSLFSELAAMAQQADENQAATEEETTPPSVATRLKTKKKGKKKPHRMPLPAHLKREVTIIEPEEDVTNMVKIGEERTETLEYLPAQLWVNLIIRPKYAPESGKTDPEGCTIHIADLPQRPLPKAIPEASLLATIAVEKYVDHLPLYRQHHRFKRLGMEIPRSTIAGWIRQTADLVGVLYLKIIELVLNSAYIQVDETTLKVLLHKKPKQNKEQPRSNTPNSKATQSEAPPSTPVIPANQNAAPPPPKVKQKGKAHQGYYWVYHGVAEKLLFFEYDPTRAQKVVYQKLKNFEGFLQSDIYSAYVGIDLLYPIRQLHCMAHARRKFEEALSNDQARATKALGLIGQLYAIEKFARTQQMDAPKRLALRQLKAKPIFDQLIQWLEEEQYLTLPKSPIGKAFAYILNRKKYFAVYLDHGHLEIDNNLVENAIRPVALGRKNYLFAGSHQAAQRGAIFYTLFSCCKMNDIDPIVWLKDVLERIQDHPRKDIEQLLPHLWKPKQSEEPPTNDDTKIKQDKAFS